MDLSRREHCCTAYRDVRAMPERTAKLNVWTPRVCKSASIFTTQHVHSGGKGQPDKLTGRCRSTEQQKNMEWDRGGDPVYLWRARICSGTLGARWHSLHQAPVGLMKATPARPRLRIRPHQAPPQWVFLPRQRPRTVHRAVGDSPALLAQPPAGAKDQSRGQCEEYFSRRTQKPSSPPRRMVGQLPANLPSLVSLRSLANQDSRRHPPPNPLYR